MSSTAGNGSYSTAIARTASRACCSDSAATIAMASP